MQKKPKYFVTFSATKKVSTCSVKNVAATFRVTIAKFGLLFIPKSGHTAADALVLLFGL